MYLHRQRFQIEQKYIKYECQRNAKARTTSVIYIYIKFDINILWNHQNCFVVAQFSRYLWIALSQEFTFSTKQIWKVIVFEMKLKTYVSTKWHPHELAQNLQSSKTDPHGFEWFQSKLQMLFSSLCTCKILSYSIWIVRSLIGSFFSTVATRGSGETPRLKWPPGKLWFMKMFMCYFSQSEQVLDGMFGFQRKNGVVWRNIGTCSSTFRYQQVKDGA